MPVTATGRYPSIVLPTILLLLLQIVAPLFGRAVPRIAAAPPHPIATPNPEPASRVAKQLGQMPMSFERNEGQANHRVHFTARGRGYDLSLTLTEAVMTLRQSDSQATQSLRMKLMGANSSPVITGLEPTGTVSNYYRGNDPSKFRTGVPHFTRVKYEQVYPGIDAVYYGHQRELEYDFLVAPGVEPNLIRMNFKGARKLSKQWRFGSQPRR